MTNNTSFLNGLRGVAAYWVLTLHCIIWGGVWDARYPDPKIAVDIFMLLSGFLMVLTVSGREAKEPMGKLANWGRFYLRRFFRIAPAYYFALACVVVFSGLFLGGYARLRALNPAVWGTSCIYDPARIHYTAENILLHTTFLFGFFPTASSSTFLPDWSLGLEMQFYLFFPIIFLVMRRLGVVKTAVFLAVIAWVVTRYVSTLAATGRMEAYYAPSLLIFRLPIFLAGMLVCEAALLPKEARGLRAAYLLLAVLFCLGMVGTYHWQILYLLLALALMIVLGIPCRIVEGRLGWLKRVCDTKVVGFMADTSYSVYLFHGVFLAIVGSRIGEAAKNRGYSLGVGAFFIWIAVTLLTVPFAYFVYRYIEVPGIDLGNRILANAKKGTVKASGA